jgi:hypothetical protein
MESHNNQPKSALPATQPDAIAAAVDLVLANPDALAEVVSRACPEGRRSDGWTPFARKLFLHVLANTGLVRIACDYTGLSRQSAYALRARDPLFAAGWDAAAEIARQPLADALYERAMDGVTETISRNGEVVAERHRHDLRCSIAVLNRLDKRADRAREKGSQHLALVRHWDAWLDLVGDGEDDAARRLLATGRLHTPEECQPCQLPDSEFPKVERDLSGRCWREDGEWLTDFAPPPGFTGYQSGHWTDPGYQRECTEEEADLLDANEEASEAEMRAEEEAERDGWFATLREQIADEPRPANGPFVEAEQSL